MYVSLVGLCVCSFLRVYMCTYGTHMHTHTHTKMAVQTTSFAYQGIFVYMRKRVRARNICVYRECKQKSAHTRKDIHTRKNLPTKYVSKHET